MQGNLLGFDISSHAVAVVKCYPEAGVGFLNSEAENDVLVIKTTKVKSSYSLKDELNHNMLCQDVVPLLIDFLRHQSSSIMRLPDSANLFDSDGDKHILLTLRNTTRGSFPENTPSVENTGGRYKDMDDGRMQGLGWAESLPGTARRHFQPRLQHSRHLVSPEVLPLGASHFRHGGVGLAVVVVSIPEEEAHAALVFRGQHLHFD